MGDVRSGEVDVGTLQAFVDGLAVEVGLRPMSLVFLLAARRRRARTRVLCGSLVAALAATACTNIRPVSAETDGGIMTTPDQGDGSSGSETGSMSPSGWPRDWYGDYYEDPGFTLGLDYQLPILIPAGLGNMRVADGELTLQRFGYEVDDTIEEWTLATELDSDVLRVLPPNGGWDILYPGAEELLVRPGTDCDELVFEVHGLPPPRDPLDTMVWSRGRLCVVDPYDEQVAGDEWMVDLCPDAVSSCDGG